MVAQRRSHTQPELKVRKALHRLGLRYALHAHVVPGTHRSVDIAFPTARVAVDVRGCYWHGCAGHATVPRANAEWWKEKIAANRQRDDDTCSRLTSAGWRVIVVWEHEDPAAAALAIAAAVREVPRRQPARIAGRPL